MTPHQEDTMMREKLEALANAWRQHALILYANGQRGAGEMSDVHADELSAILAESEPDADVPLTGGVESMARAWLAVCALCRELDGNLMYDFGRTGLGCVLGYIRHLHALSREPDADANEVRISHTEWVLLLKAAGIPEESWKADSLALLSRLRAPAPEGEGERVVCPEDVCPICYHVFDVCSHCASPAPSQPMDFEEFAKHVPERPGKRLPAPSEQEWSAQQMAQYAGLVVENLEALKRGDPPQLHHDYLGYALSRARQVRDYLTTPSSGDEGGGP